MPRLIRRLLLLSIVCAGCAFGQFQGQGTFAQIAFGGSWQTTFTLVNQSSDELANVTLTFFGDSGAPLNAPVQGFGSTSSYTFTIPISGSTNVVLASTDPSVTQGWASMTVTAGIVRGQGSFRFLLPTGVISEAVVPLSPAPSACIIGFPTSNNPVIQIPFDNTGGQDFHFTSLAIANISGAPLTVAIDFDDQSNNQLVRDTLTLAVNQHMAFLSTQSYPALAGKKGILRIHEDTSSVTVLGLLSNATSAITTIIPITQ
jgi:S1-C subfamily serine protease